jgi:hypothetical protein
MDSVATKSSTFSLAEHRRRQREEDDRRAAAGQKAADTRAAREKAHREEATALANLALKKVVELAGPRSEVRLTGDGLLTAFGWAEHTYVRSDYATKNRKRRYGVLSIYLYAATAASALSQADLLASRLIHRGVPASVYGWVNFDVPNKYRGGVTTDEVRAGDCEHNDPNWSRGAHATVTIDLDVLAEEVARQLEAVERGG